MSPDFNKWSCLPGKLINSDFQVILDVTIFIFTAAGSSRRCFSQTSVIKEAHEQANKRSLRHPQYHLITAQFAGPAGPCHLTRTFSIYARPARTRTMTPVTCRRGNGHRRTVRWRPAPAAAVPRTGRTAAMHFGDSDRPALLLYVDCTKMQQCSASVGAVDFANKAVCGEQC